MSSKAQVETTTYITVCMPIYNSANYIADAIESVLAQKLNNFELLIIDDGSSDGTFEIAAYYAERDSRIRLFKNITNIGMVNNWNRCIQEASGQYIKFLFGDDRLAPDSLLQMSNILKREAHVSLVTSSRSLIDNESRYIGEWKHFATGIYNGVDVIRQCIIEQLNLVGEPSAVMFRKQQSGRGFDTNYKQMVDLEMWYHLLEQGSLAYIQEPLCEFRRHSEQMTSKNEKNLVNFSEFFMLSNIYLHKPYIDFGEWKIKWFLFERYYTFWKIFKKQPAFRQIAEEIIFRQYGKKNFIWTMILYKLYNPIRKLYGLALPHE